MSKPPSEAVPFISVVTPVYNARKFLPRLFESVQSQQGVRVEHILVDDCSTDGSLAFMQDMAKANPLIKVVRLSSNQGPVAARNMGISLATGKYLAFLDADDYWLPQKALVQAQFMAQTGAAMSFTDYRFISEDGQRIGRRLQGPASVGFALHHMTRYLGCLTVMVNRERCTDFLFPAITPAYRAEDFLAWSVVISGHGPALRCPHDLARYAVVANSRSSGALRAAKSVWKLYRNVEALPLVRAALYFSVYAAFALWKRHWFRPLKVATVVDGALADRYRIDKAEQ
jgi:teichuronic acid biosynthesis glycosyltransferase TuaG